VFGLIIKAEFLSTNAETIMSVITLVVALLVFGFAYYAYCHEVGRCSLTLTHPS